MSRTLDIRRREPRSLSSLFVEEEHVRRGLGATPGAEEERWRIEAEVLRAECKFLRMERDLAFRKLEESQGRKKLDGSRRLMVVDVSTLRRRRRKERLAGAAGSNFDRNASVVRRQLAAADDDRSHEEREIREVIGSSDATAAVPPSRKEDDAHVEMLRRKMEGMSRGMLQKVEECGSLLSQPASGSGRNGHYQRQVDQGMLQQPGRTGSGGCRCNCRCRLVVARIAEQVKAEKEHWSEMQAMLDQVRVEMEDLRSSRDHWQSRAVASELQLRTLHNNIMEWKQKAQASENNVAKLRQQMSRLGTSRGERPNARSTSSRSLRSSGDGWDAARLPKIRCQQREQGRRTPDDYASREKEKRVLICHLRGSGGRPAGRTPLRDVGNLSPPRRKCSDTK